MKTRYFQISLLAAATSLAFIAGKVDAQISTVSAQSAVAGQFAPQLSYGVPQVLQLVQAKISDSVIVNYIQSSSTIYSLSADEIVYLKQQGVSDNALNAMLNQRSRVSGYTQPAATTTSASAPASSVPATSDQSYSATAPAVTYVQQAAQPSTVYVVPNTQTYYYSYPYYSGYYYGWPAISLSFGYYGGYYWGGSYYRGSYCSSSSWHGSSGGSWHGSSGGGGWHGGGSVSWHGGGGGGGHH
jgi:hypothetical protein